MLPATRRLLKPATKNMFKLFSSQNNLDQSSHQNNIGKSPQQIKSTHTPTAPQGIFAAFVEDAYMRELKEGENEKMKSLEQLQDEDSNTSPSM